MALVLDTAARANHLKQFFKQRNREKAHAMQADAEKKESDFLSLLRSGNTRPGQMLSHKEITKRLVKLNPNLVIHQSIAYPDQGAVYVRDGRANMDDLNLGYRGLKMVAGMGWGMVPENTCGTIIRDEKGDEKGTVSVKGWRTTLCQLIQTRLITLTQAEKAFGSGGKGWHERLH